MRHKVIALTQNPKFMRYFKNSSWMMAEYSLKIISAIFVTIYIARYLGPESFGILSYALAIVAIFMAISRLGMDSILVRDLAKYPDQAKAYIGTAFILMFVAAIAGLVVISAVIYFFDSEPQTKIYIWILASGLMFQTLLVVDYNFQSQVKAKYSSIAKSIALMISSAIKIVLVWVKADLLLFTIAYALDHVIIALMLTIAHFIAKQPGFLFVFHRNLVKPVLKSAWPMILTAGMGVLLLKFDQVLIGIMLSKEELGYYTAALRLYEGWVIFPQVIAMSLIPAIVEIKYKSEEIYKIKMIQFMRAVILINLVVAVTVTMFSENIIELLYGKSFYLSVDVLKIVIWCALVMGVGSVSFRYLINEGLERKIVRIMAMALFSNIFLNLIFVPFFGIHGAAMALLISMSMSYLFHDFFDLELRQLKEIKLRAIYVW